MKKNRKKNRKKDRKKKKDKTREPLQTSPPKTAASVDKELSSTKTSSEATSPSKSTGTGACATQSKAHGLTPTELKTTVAQLIVQALQNPSQLKPALVKINQLAIQPENFEQFILHAQIQDIDKPKGIIFNTTPIFAYLLKSFDYAHLTDILSRLNEPAHRSTLLLRLGQPIKAYRIIETSSIGDLVIGPPVEMNCLQYLLDYAKPENQGPLINFLTRLTQPSPDPKVTKILCQLLAQETFNTPYIEQLLPQLINNRALYYLVFGLLQQNEVNKQQAKPHWPVDFFRVTGLYLQKANEKIDEPKDDDHHLQLELKSTAKKLKVALQENQKKQAAIAQLTKGMKQLEQTKQNHEHEQKKSLAKLAKLKAETNAIIASERLNLEESLKAQHDQLKDQFDTQLNKQTKKTEQHANQVQTLHQAKQQQAATIEKSNGIIQKQKAKITAYQKKLATQRAETQQLHALRFQIQEQYEQNDQLKGELEKRTTKQNTLEEKVSHLTTQLKKRTSALHKIKAQLTQKIKSLNGERQQLKKTIEEMSIWHRLAIDEILKSLKPFPLSPHTLTIRRLNSSDDGFFNPRLYPSNVSNQGGASDLYSNRDNYRHFLRAYSRTKSTGSHSLCERVFYQPNSIPLPRH